VILKHTTDQECNNSDPTISHCFGSHEDVFDDYPELDEDAWREHLVTAIIDRDGDQYGVVRGDQGRHEVYDVKNPTGEPPDIDIDSELQTRLGDALDRMADARTTDSSAAVSDRLKDLGYL
jgi:hypothetical protein